MKASVKPILLNRSEATHILHLHYNDFLIRSGAKNIHPDFYSILVENSRNPITDDAIKKGYAKGNRGKYGKVESFKINGHHMYAKHTLKEWFLLHFAPKALMAA